MERGEHFTKTGPPKPFKEGVRRFFDQRFDWIALIIITIVILVSLILF